MTADEHRAANARGLEVHLRTIALGPVTYRVVTLRPATTARFSSNYFHDTWHILASICCSLRQRLRDRRAPTSTIRWHTFGLAAALACDRDLALWRHAEHRARRDREQMSRRAGFVCYTAPPDVLAVYRMREAGRMSYHPLAAGAGGRWPPDGEVQILRDFDDDVGAATVARRDVMPGVTRGLASDHDRSAVYARKDEVARRLRRARGQA